VTLLIILAGLGYARYWYWQKRPRYTWVYVIGTSHNYQVYRNGEPYQRIRCKYGIIPFDMDTGHQYNLNYYHRYITEIKNDAKRQHTLKSTW